MLLFNTIQSSSDLATNNADQQMKIDANISKEKFDIASSIVSDFLSSILANTLTNERPVHVYEYDVSPDIDLRDLQFTVDDLFYHIFNKNLYALPDVFYKQISDLNPISKIVIHAPNTVKSITSTDKRLEREISDLLFKKTELLRTGNAVVYTGFEHLVASLPNLYAISRSESLIKTLNNKGYVTHFEPTSMYLTLSIR